MNVNVALCLLDVLFGNREETTLEVHFQTKNNTRRHIAEFSPVKVRH